MHIHETTKYRECVDVVACEIIRLKENLEELKHYKRGTPGIADKRAQVRSSLKTREAKLAKFQSLDGFSTFELIHILAEMEGTVWTPEQAEAWNSERAIHEGKGEKSLRMRFGLPLVSSQCEGDLGELGEVKCIQASATKQAASRPSAWDGRGRAPSDAP